MQKPVFISLGTALAHRHYGLLLYLVIGDQCDLYTARKIMNTLYVLKSNNRDYTICGSRVHGA